MKYMDFFKNKENFRQRICYTDLKNIKEEALNRLISIIRKLYGFKLPGYRRNQITAEDIILAAETLPFLSDKKWLSLRTIAAFQAKTGDEEELKVSAKTARYHLPDFLSA